MRHRLRLSFLRPLLVVAAMVLATASALILSPSTVVQAATSGPSNYQGFDTCSTPSTSQMLTWWNDSPYYTIFVYVGGENACTREGSIAWYSTVMAQGWQVVPIWVGLQAPCTSPGKYYTMSIDPTTAYSQGYNDASSAVAKSRYMGFGSYSPVVDDIEYYDAGNSGCNAAVRAYASGWDAGVNAHSFTPLIYESASDVSSLVTIGTVPANVWIAGGGYPASQYRSSETVWGNSYVPNEYWINDQRHYQYTGQHSETWGPLTLPTIDSDVSNGRVYNLYGTGVDFDGSGLNQIEGSEGNSPSFDS